MRHCLLVDHVLSAPCLFLEPENLQMFVKSTVNISFLKSTQWRSTASWISESVSLLSEMAKQISGALGRLNQRSQRTFVLLISQSHRADEQDQRRPIFGPSVIFAVHSRPSYNACSVTLSKLWGRSLQDAHFLKNFKTTNAQARSHTGI